MKLTRTFRIPIVQLIAPPLLNVLIMVLIFFALSSMLTLQSGVQVVIPSSPFLLKPKSGTQLLTIKAGPPDTIYFRDQPVSLDLLKSALAGTKSSDRTILIKADHRIDYGRIMEVANIALESGFTVLLAGGEKLQPK